VHISMIIFDCVHISNRFLTFFRKHAGECEVCGAMARTKTALDILLLWFTYYAAFFRGTTADNVK